MIQAFDQALRATVDGATKGADMFRKEVQGHHIRSMAGSQAGVSISYAVTEKWLLLTMGADQFLNQVIDRMQSIKNLWTERRQKRFEGFP